MDKKSASLNHPHSSNYHRYHFLARFVLVSSLVAVAYVGYFWYNQLYATPIELYHRVWQAAKDYYFDKNALEAWGKYEHCYDGQIKTNEDAINSANKMLSSFGDPFTTLYSPKEIKLFAELQSEKFVGLGVSLQTVSLRPDNTKYLAVVSVLPEGPARKAGIQPGDTIISINGKESAGMTVFELKEIVAKRENQNTDVVVQRGERRVRLQLIPALVHRTNVELQSTDKQFAHIVVSDFLKKNTADRVMKVLERTAHRRAIVLDLRGNPGGSVDECLRLASAFLKDGHLVTLNVRSAGAGHHNEIYSLKPDCIEIAITDDDGKIFRVRKQPRLRPIAALRPLIVLVNGGTASAAEMLAAALQDNNRARIVGTRSYGKGIAQTGMPMANGTILNLTCVHYFTPSGRFIGMGRGGSKPAEGIVPDISISNPSDSHVDHQLSRALQLLSTAYKCST